MRNPVLISTRCWITHSLHTELTSYPFQWILISRSLTKQSQLISHREVPIYLTLMKRTCINLRFALLTKVLALEMSAPIYTVGTNSLHGILQLISFPWTRKKQSDRPDLCKCACVPLWCRFLKKQIPSLLRAECWNYFYLFFFWGGGLFSSFQQLFSRNFFY